MLSTQINWKSGGRIVSLALLGGMTLSGGVSSATTAPVSAAPRAPETQLVITGPWLCRTWSGGAGSAAPGLAAASGAVDAGSAGYMAIDAPQTTPVTISWDGSQAGSVQVETMSAAAVSTAAAPTLVGGTFGDTTIHCTRNWHVDAHGNLISGAPGWVPIPADAWSLLADDVGSINAYNRTHRAFHRPAPPTKPKPRPVYVAPQTHSTGGTGNNNGGGGSYGPPSGPYSPWAPVPGHPSYGMSDFGGDPYSGYFGVCTWYAWYRHQGEPLMRLGNAAAWAWNAPHFGLRVGTVPVVGATAVFQPGVEGAGGGGHVGHVEMVLGGGWFVISEMNFAWNGGGWGRVDWRFVYVTSGVSFIY